MDVLKRIENYGVIPVVKIEKPEQALPLAKALCEGELEAAEITFRTDCGRGCEVLRGERYLCDAGLRDGNGGADGSFLRLKGREVFPG